MFSQPRRSERSMFWSLLTALVIGGEPFRVRLLDAEEWKDKNEFFAAPEGAT